MSLGFLTESALLPSKAKEIKVDSKSILDLKAVVFQKEQERKERRRRLHDEVGDDADMSRRRKRTHDQNDDVVGKNVYARLKATKRSRKEPKEKERNRGVDERQRRDEEQRELDVDNSDDDAALQQKSREMLARKAKLYEQMMQGKRDGVPVVAVNECLVDFDGKRRAGELSAFVGDNEYQQESETIEITDEFGRTRLVEKGSKDHLEFMRGEGQELSDSLFFEDKGQKASKEEQGRPSGGTGSFVVSQWEKTLKSSEKVYLEQVHAGVELAKQTNSAMTDKQRRKQLRLEKLKQQAQAQPQSTSTEATQHPQQEKEAAVQATAFLNEMTSWM